MTNFRRRLRGIRWRLIGAIVTVVALAQLAWGLVQADQEAEQIRADAKTNGLALLRATVEPLAVPLANRELTTLDAALARIAETQGNAVSTVTPSGTPELPLAWVAILDSQGRVVAHTEPAHYGEDWSARPQVQQAMKANQPVIREVTLAKGPALRLGIPVEAGLRWGTALTEISMIELEGEIEQRRQRIIIQGVILGGGLAGLLSLLLGLLVVAPITRFSVVTRAISRGDLSARVELEGSVLELEMMGESFNEMARQIQGQTQLLEQQVLERTSELQGVNQELEEAVAQLQQQARTDGLTGLLNHRSFQEALGREIERSARYGQPLALMMIDVDHFKSYNDTHGHPAGDEVLKTLAGLFLGSLRSTDRVARYGGEEFAVLVINSDMESATRVGTKIIEAVRSQAFRGEAQSQPSGQVTISVGVACYPSHAQDGASLLEAADQALYAAKNAGRDRLSQAPPEKRT
jgi:diguanylate cyclase (GGDEF)-like protein